MRTIILESEFFSDDFHPEFYSESKGTSGYPQWIHDQDQVKVAESRSMLINLQSILVKKEEIGVLSMMSIGCQPFQAIRNLRRDRHGSLPFLRFFPSGDHRENHQ